MTEAKEVMEMATNSERSDVRYQERIAMAIALLGAGLAVMFSPWWLLLAVFFAIGHWLTVDEAERVGAHETRLQQAQRVAEALVAAGVNERFQAEGVPLKDRAARFDICSLSLKRDGQDGLVAHALVKRDDGAAYEVWVASPPAGSDREPGIEVRSLDAQHAQDLGQEE